MCIINPYIRIKYYTNKEYDPAFECIVSGSGIKMGYVIKCRRSSGLVGRVCRIDDVMGIIIRKKRK